MPNEEVYAKYAIDKCQLLLATHKIIEEKIKTNDQTKLYYEVELPLAPILGDIEMQGFKVNRNRLNEIGTYLQKQKSQSLPWQVMNLMYHHQNSLV